MRPWKQAACSLIHARPSSPTMPVPLVTPGSRGHPRFYAETPPRLPTDSAQNRPFGAGGPGVPRLASSGGTKDGTMTQKNIPAGPEHVTDAWLTAALRESGTLGSGEVIAHTTQLLELQGAAAIVARIALDYDRPDPDAPASLVAKFASPYEPIRALLHQIRGYEREVEFYRLFGAEPGIPIPRCFFADIDPASGVFALLLEDMSEARVIDGTLPFEEDIELAVRHLAPFHAKWWSHPRLSTLEFLHPPGSASDTAFMAQGRAALAMSLPLARQRFYCGLPPIVH